MSFGRFLLQLIGSAAVGTLAAPLLLVVLALASGAGLGDIARGGAIYGLVYLVALSFCLPVTVIAGLLAAAAKRAELFDAWSRAVPIGGFAGALGGVIAFPVPFTMMLGGAVGGATGLFLWLSRATAYSFARKRETV